MNWMKGVNGYVSSCGKFVIRKRKGGDFDVYHDRNVDRINAACGTLKSMKEIAAKYAPPASPLPPLRAKPIAMPASERRTRRDEPAKILIDPAFFSKGQSRAYRKRMRKLGLSFPKSGQFVVMDSRGVVVEPRDVAMTKLGDVVTKDGAATPVKLAG